jgi:hypothetical protein
MPRRSLQFPTQCHEQDCVLNVGQFRVQIMRQSGSVFGANQQPQKRTVVMTMGDDSGVSGLGIWLGEHVIERYSSLTDLIAWRAAVALPQTLCLHAFEVRN